MSISKAQSSAVIWLKASVPIKPLSSPMRLWTIIWLKRFWTIKSASTLSPKKNQACSPACFTACCRYCCWLAHGFILCVCKVAAAVRGAHSLSVKAVPVFWTKMPTKLPLPMLPVAMRQKRKCRKSLITWKLQAVIKVWADAFRAVSYWQAARVPVKLCWQKPLQAKQAYRSSASQVLTLLKCSSGSVQAACAICLNKRRKTPLVSFLLTKSTLSAVSAVPVWAVVMMSANKPWTSFWSRWTVLKVIRPLSLLPQPTVRTY